MVNPALVMGREVGGAGLGSTWVNHVARNGGRGLGGYIKILW